MNTKTRKWMSVLLVALMFTLSVSAHGNHDKNGHEDKFEDKFSECFPNCHEPPNTPEDSLNAIEELRDKVNDEFDEIWEELDGKASEDHEHDYASDDHGHDVPDHEHDYASEEDLEELEDELEDLREELEEIEEGESSGEELEEIQDRIDEISEELEEHSHEGHSHDGVGEHTHDELHEHDDDDDGDSIGDVDEIKEDIADLQKELQDAKSDIKGLERDVDNARGGGSYGANDLGKDLNVVGQVLRGENPRRSGWARGFVDSFFDVFATNDRADELEQRIERLEKINAYLIMQTDEDFDVEAASRLSAANNWTEFEYGNIRCNVVDSYNGNKTFQCSRPG